MEADSRAPEAVTGALAVADEVGKPMVSLKVAERLQEAVAADVEANTDFVCPAEAAGAD